jgi:hypothetical protein
MGWEVPGGNDPGPSPAIAAPVPDTQAPAVLKQPVEVLLVVQPGGCSLEVGRRLCWAGVHWARCALQGMLPPCLPPRRPWMPAATVAPSPPPPPAGEELSTHIASRSLSKGELAANQGPLLRCQGP